VLEQSKKAAQRLLLSSQSGARERIQRAYREVLARDASTAELERSLQFVDAMRSMAKSDGTEVDETTAWARLYQALFASAEFRYRS